MSTSPAQSRKFDDFETIIWENPLDPTAPKQKNINRVDKICLKHLF